MYLSTELQFVCPSCQRSLSLQGTDISCAHCGSVGQIIDGIPCFTDPSYYWGEIPHDRMRNLNEIALREGWQEGVERIVENPALRSYITDPSRADFQYVWDVSADSTVLDIGAGLGAIATSLAKNFRRVVAVEGVFERCRFIDTRARQSGYPHLQVICADFLRVPLAPAQFDVVVLNGVLEWSAMNGTGDPRDVQILFLRKVFDLLKPSGIACIGIENRIGWAALRGATDHSGLSYTSLMPRWMAAAWARRKATYRSDLNEGYRTYTYSLPGFHRLFREAGFRTVKTFHAWDGYNNPSVLVSLERTEDMQAFRRRMNLSRQGMRGRIKDTILTTAARTGVWRHLASEYIFLVGKS